MMALFAKINPGVIWLLIAIKEKEKDFDILITELNEKVRSRKLSVNKSIAYLVGIYQKKGML